jgi:hypothetical protein
MAITHRACQTFGQAEVILVICAFIALMMLSAWHSQNGGKALSCSVVGKTPSAGKSQGTRIQSMSQVLAGNENLPHLLYRFMELHLRFHHWKESPLLENIVWTKLFENDPLDLAVDQLD